MILVFCTLIKCVLRASRASISSNPSRVNTSIARVRVLACDSPNDVESCRDRWNVSIRGWKRRDSVEEALSRGINWLGGVVEKNNLFCRKRSGKSGRGRSIQPLVHTRYLLNKYLSFISCFCSPRIFFFLLWVDCLISKLSLLKTLYCTTRLADAC